MDINTKRFLQSLASKASEAADEARMGLESAGKAVAEKYDAARLSYELSRVKGEQERIFANIGSAVFYMNIGTLQQEDSSSTQQTIDSLLLSAEQKQQEIDAITDRLSELSKSATCPTCKRVCDSDDTFCSSCGAKL